MSCKPVYLITQETDPVRNLALEAFLLESVRPDECILYLWQNRNTVVIGKNQNSRSECRLDVLSRDGGTLVRRLSGGGAVYHDLGNLNFTFLVCDCNYDLKRQLSVILEAVRSFGVRAEITGRNDLAADGRKFSGNAFYRHGEQRYHHGTILISVDMSKMSRYLNVSAEKLASHGVKSVRSRTVNLSELCSAITVQSMEKSLVAAFGTVYGEPAVPYEEQMDEARLAELTRQFGSDEWRFGREPEAACRAQARYVWGSADLQLAVQGGSVVRAVLYTDAMEEGLAASVAAILEGKPYDPAHLASELKNHPEPRLETRQMLCDLADLVAGMNGQQEPVAGG